MEAISVPLIANKTVLFPALKVPPASIPHASPTTPSVIVKVDVLVPPFSTPPVSIMIYWQLA